MVTKVDPSVVDDQVLGRRDLIINGDMRVNQRGTLTTGGSSIYTLDRFLFDYNGGTMTCVQSDLSSSDTPYSHGFRNAIKLTNSSVGSDAAANYVRFQQRIEAQNLANSGWNYTSDTSFVTLSFWVKSSLAGTYAVTLQNIESSASEDYSFEFTLTANTWTKVTHAIKGNSEIVFDNDTGEGLRIAWFPYIGTNYTTSSNTLETWGAYTSTDQTKDYAQNWSATASATFEVTGIQLEVGDQATLFEHRSIGEELALCQRYFYKEVRTSGALFNFVGFADNSTTAYIQHIYPVSMRSEPTLSSTGTTGDYSIRVTGNTLGCSSLPSLSSGNNHVSHVAYSVSSGLTGGQAVVGKFDAADVFLGFDAEI